MLRRLLDLRGGGNYDDLHDALESYRRWAHVLESTWIVDTNDSATEVRDDLKKHVDSDDGIFVSPYARPSAWSNTIADPNDLKDFLQDC